LPGLYEYVDERNVQNIKPQPKTFEKKTSVVSERFEGKVRVKREKTKFSFEDDRIPLKGDEEYLKLCGITSTERTQLFCSNERFVYLLELTNNLDNIATSILGGELDQMLLITADGEEDKCQFFVKNEIIYIIYGKFPDKKGKYFLEQMANFYGELVRDKDVNNLNKLEKHEIDRKFEAQIRAIINKYIQLQDVFSDQEIPFVEDKLRIDYLGLSSMSIGVISLLLGNELGLKFPGETESPEEEKEMIESLLTAKIEAIAANTLGNTGAYPRWIAVKLGFQNYRFLTFKKYKNDFFLYMLSEGNLEKLNITEDYLDPFIEHVIDTPFSGTLKPFNRLKKTLDEMLIKHNRFFQ
jgi:acyl carrier protein